MKNELSLTPASIALHVDRDLENHHGIAPPITQSVTYFSDDNADFAFRAKEPLHDTFYARHGNPTSSRIAKIIAHLEGGETAMMFASGMGAITTAVLAHLSAGDHVVAQTNHYIGTTNLMRQVLPRFGVAVTQVDQRSLEAFEQAIRPNTKLIMVETPVNPTMQLTDLASIANLATERGITSMCDNTVATPLNQKPLDLGIDVVAHSVTKYIGGHHDLLAGCIVGSKDTLDRVWDMSMTVGALSAPMNSWLALRGIRTLAMRVRQHNENALAVAQMLAGHPAIEVVHYPGLQSHPQHELAQRQMSGYGGLLSFVLKGGYDAGVKFLKATQLVQNAGSLGGVDTLAIQPAAMWGGRLPDEVIKEQGVRPGMIRFATGIEDTSDLVSDVERALEAR